MSPYCSAHDEWLIMKLCMYVGYHDANNVSHFGGAPATQLNLKQLFIVLCCPSEHMSPYCSAHDEWLIMKLCMYVEYHDANNVSNFGGDPVTQLKKNYSIIYDVLRTWHSIAAAVATRPRADCSSIEGHTSLSTALVYHSLSRL